MVRREPYNPVQLNAKSGFAIGYECTICWAFIIPERTENHANWHERQDKKEREGKQHGNETQSEPDPLAEAHAEVKRIESERADQEPQREQDSEQESSQRSRRDPRSRRS